VLLCTSHREARFKKPRYQTAAIRYTAHQGSSPHKGQPRMQKAERYDVGGPQRGQKLGVLIGFLLPGRISVTSPSWPDSNSTLLAGRTRV